MHGCTMYVRNKFCNRNGSIPRAHCVIETSQIQNESWITEFKGRTIPLNHACRAHYINHDLAGFKPDGITKVTHKNFLKALSLQEYTCLTEYTRTYSNWYYSKSHTVAQYTADEITRVYFMKILFSGCVSLGLTGQFKTTR